MVQIGYTIIVWVWRPHHHYYPIFQAELKLNCVVAHIVRLHPSTSCQKPKFEPTSLETNIHQKISIISAAQWYPARKYFAPSYHLPAVSFTRLVTIVITTLQLMDYIINLHRSDIHWRYKLRLMHKKVKMRCKRQRSQEVSTRNTNFRLNVCFQNQSGRKRVV